MQEVRNYPRAPTWPTANERGLSISLRLTKEMHAILFDTGSWAGAPPANFGRHRIGFRHQTISQRLPGSFLRPSRSCGKPSMTGRRNLHDDDPQLPLLIRCALLITSSKPFTHFWTVTDESDVCSSSSIWSNWEESLLCSSTSLANSTNARASTTTAFSSSESGERSMNGSISSSPGSPVRQRTQ